MSELNIPKHNSAGNLADNLKELVTNNHHDHKVIDKIRSSFEIPEENHTYYYDSLLSLIYTIQSELVSFPDGKRINYQHTLNELKSIIYRLSHEQHLKWKDLDQKFKDTRSHIFRDLENMAYDFDELNSQKDIEPKDLEIIQQEIHNLIAKVSKSNINKELRFILLKKLNLCQDVINNYDLYGSNGIQNELENISGTIICNLNKVHTEEERSLVAMTIEWTFKTLGAVSAANNILSSNAVEWFSKLLPPS